MKTFPFTFTMIAAGLLGVSLLAGEEPVAEAPIHSLGLFKNGTVTVTRRVDPPKSGVAFLLPRGFRHAHGTLWADADAPLRFTTVRRSVPAEIPNADLTSLYAGRQVVLTVQAEVTNLLARAAAAEMDTVFVARSASSVVEELAGTVVGATSPGAAPPSPPLHANTDTRWSSALRLGGGSPAPTSQDSGFLTLRTDEGVSVRLPVQAIVGIRSAGVNTHKPILEDALRVEGATRPFDVTYIAQGASWSPAYRIVLRDPKRMRLSMSAVLRNELEDFRDARVTLISGFPNIEYAGTDGLMSPGMTLEPFFQRLSNPRGGRGASVLSQQAVMYNVSLNAAVPGAGFTAFDLKELGASSDIHYRDIGKLAMASGESMYLVLDDAETDYERVVEWTVSDRRNERGQIDRNELADDFWDVVRFANPFKTPLTTAPVEVFDGDRLLGQSTAFWTNPGQATSAKITKALSVSGNCSETESDEGRTNVRIDGYDYYKTAVDGELRVRNYRGIPVKLVVNLGFTGEYLSASPEPGDRRVLASGVYSVNKRQSMMWTLDLQPGEEQTVAYRYSVLVRR